jgi:hypothetical protein
LIKCLKVYFEKAESVKKLRGERIEEDWEKIVHPILLGTESEQPACMFLLLSGFLTEAAFY